MPLKDKAARAASSTSQNGAPTGVTAVKILCLQGLAVELSACLKILPSFMTT